MLFRKNKKHSGCNPPGAPGYTLPVSLRSSRAKRQGDVRPLDAPDHGMVTRALLKSISSPGMIAFLDSSPSLRQKTTILWVQGRRDVHFEVFRGCPQHG